MPCFERQLRSLEKQLAATPEEKAFIEGKHRGMNTARKQVAVICFVVGVIYVLTYLVTH